MRTAAGSGWRHVRVRSALPAPRVCCSCANRLSSSAVGRASIPPGPLKAGVRVIHDDGAAVDVSDIGHVHVHHGAVVEECAASPFAATKTYAAVSEAVVNAAVEADVRSPIASVPAIEAARKAPVARASRACPPAQPPMCREPSSSRPDHSTPNNPASRDSPDRDRWAARTPAARADRSAPRSQFRFAPTMPSRATAPKPSTSKLPIPTQPRMERFIFIAFP
jgi:hypothetical protein